jgi:hypothetical protein
MGAGERRGLIVAGLLAALAIGIWLWLRGNGAPRTTEKTDSSASQEEPDQPEITRTRAPARTATAVASAFAPPTRTRRDKVLREQARQRIFQALGASESGNPSGNPAAQTPAPTLDKDYIQARIRGDFMPMARECYDAALERDGGLSGTMVFQFAIVGDESVGGIVESAELDPSSTLAEPEFVTCMRESLLSVTFVPPAHGGRVTVTYPFVLSPGDGG